MQPLNETEVVLSAGIAKKVGRPNYSSYEANLNIEIKTNLASVTDERFPELVGVIYTKIQEAVDARIAWECRADQGPNLVPKFAPEILHPQAVAPPSAPASAPAPAPSPVGFAFRDYLAQTCNELAVSPESLVNYFYRVFIASKTQTPVPDAAWQQQGAALAEHWTSIPNAPAAYSQSLNSMPAF